MGIIKFAGNPILTKDDVPFKVNSIFNPGAIKHDGKYLLLCRVEMPNGRSSFVIAKSDNGEVFRVEDKPCLTPDDHGEFKMYAEWGIEDPRIVNIGNKYLITYTGYSNLMPVVMLAETEDFIKFKIHGPVSEPTNKDSIIFPEKINGYYWKIDRPSAEGRNDIWINQSPDLIHWGNYHFVTEPKSGSWEQNKIGASTPPVKTKDGWLFLYHGVRGFGISYLYKIGVMLLDLNEPWKIKGRSEEPIIIPELDYERTGDVGNVVFTNGWVVEDNGDVNIYYSGADTNICLAKTNIEYLLAQCK